MHVYTNRRLLTHVKVFYFFHMGAVDASKLGHNFDQQDQRRTEMSNMLLPPFQNIRCFRFVNQMYLDIL
jgi:hypothetical protein